MQNISKPITATLRKSCNCIFQFAARCKPIDKRNYFLVQSITPYIGHSVQNLSWCAITPKEGQSLPVTGWRSTSTFSRQHITPCCTYNLVRNLSISHLAVLRSTL